MSDTKKARVEKNTKTHTAQEPLVLYLKMELPAAGEHVFAVESIEKKRSRKVGHKSTEGHLYTHAHGEGGSILYGFISPPHGLHVYFYFFYEIYL